MKFLLIALALIVVSCQDKPQEIKVVVDVDEEKLAAAIVKGLTEADRSKLIDEEKLGKAIGNGMIHASTSLADTLDEEERKLANSLPSVPEDEGLVMIFKMASNGSVVVSLDDLHSDFNSQADGKADTEAIKKWIKAQDLREVRKARLDVEKGAEQSTVKEILNFLAEQGVSSVSFSSYPK